MKTRQIVVAVSCIVLFSLLPNDTPRAQSHEQLPAIDGVALSPDGRSMAYIMLHQGLPHLAIQDLTSAAAAVLLPPVENLEFRWLRWANNERLVFALQFPAKRGFTATQETRLLAIDKNGKNLESIIQNATRVEIGSRIGSDLAPPQIQDNVIDWLPQDPDHILISLDADHDGRNEVRRVDINGGHYDLVQEGLPGIKNHLADRNGEIRFGWGKRRNNRVAWYKRADDKWIDVTESEWWQSGYQPVVFEAEADQVLLQGPGDNGRTCIRRANLATGELLEVVYEHDSVDIDGVILEPVTRQAIGYRFTDELPKESYSDEQMTALQRAILNALPDSSSQIASMSHNRRQIIVYAATADDKGSYYLWDRDLKSIELIGKKLDGASGSGG